MADGSTKGGGTGDTLANRVVLIVGIIAIGGLVGIVLQTAGTDGWIIGIVTSAITLVLTAVLLRSSSRRGGG